MPEPKMTDVVPEVTRHVFGCCSWADSWVPEFEGQPHPDIQGWGEDSYRDSYIAAEDYDALKQKLAKAEADSAIENEKAERIAKLEAEVAELTKRCGLFVRGLEAEEQDCEHLHSELDAEKQQVATLTAEVERLNLPKTTTCFYCSKHVAYSSIYRCYDCDGDFHKDCLKLHIRQSDPRTYLCARRQEQERDALKAQLEAMSKPVTDEEWLPNFGWAEDSYRAKFDRILAARAARKDGGQG